MLTWLLISKLFKISFRFKFKSKIYYICGLSLWFRYNPLMLLWLSYLVYLTFLIMVEGKYSLLPKIKRWRVILVPATLYLLLKKKNKQKNLQLVTITQQESRLKSRYFFYFNYFRLFTSNFSDRSQQIFFCFVF